MSVHCGSYNNYSIVAHGNGAYRSFGRDGYWDEFLVTIDTFPCIFYINPVGKREPFYLLFEENAVHKVPQSERNAFNSISDTLIPETDYTVSHL